MITAQNNIEIICLLKASFNVTKSSHIFLRCERTDCRSCSSSTLQCAHMSTCSVQWSDSYFKKEDRFPAHLLGIRVRVHIRLLQPQPLIAYINGVQGCDPTHSFAAQWSADSDFQRAARVQSVNKRPVHSAEGAGQALDQTPAKPDMRPATAREEEGGGLDTRGIHLGFIPGSLQPSGHRTGPGYKRHEYKVHLTSCARLKPWRTPVES